MGGVTRSRSARLPVESALNRLSETRYPFPQNRSWLDGYLTCLMATDEQRRDVLADPAVEEYPGGRFYLADPGGFPRSAALVELAYTSPPTRAVEYASTGTFPSPPAAAEVAEDSPDDRPNLDEIRRWPATVSIRESAKALGVSAGHAYECVKTGTYPVKVIRVGSRHVVLTWSILEVLGGGSG